MTFTDVKKQLKQLEYDKLIALLGELYKKNTTVKEYLDALITPNKEDLYEKYEGKVYLAFFPKRGHNYSLKTAKKAISDFKQLGATPKLVAELMLFYVETGTLFIQTYGDIEENAYTSFENTFEKALGLIKKIGLLDEFQERISELVSSTSGTGYGYEDTLSWMYKDVYGKDDEDE